MGVVEKYNNTLASPIAHGSLVRTTWPDEVLAQHSVYDAANNDGWISPGIYTFANFKLLESFMRRAAGGGDMRQTIIPHGAKGLLIIDHHWVIEKGEVPELWYKLLYKEQTIWADHREIVLLEKHSTTTTTQ